MSDKDQASKKNSPQIELMLRAIELSRQNLSTLNGGPFGAVIVQNGKIIAEGKNEVLASNDPTAHAEVVAIRNASKILQKFDLSDCEIYTSCEPCPMCLSAIYWARLQRIFYANSRQDAAEISFDDEMIYNEIPLNPDLRKIKSYRCCEMDAKKVFQDWVKIPAKKLY
jgi:guanine deaminase